MGPVVFPTRLYMAGDGHCPVALPVYRPSSPGMPGVSLTTCKDSRIPSFPARSSSSTYHKKSALVLLLLLNLQLRFSLPPSPSNVLQRACTNQYLPLFPALDIPYAAN